MSLGNLKDTSIFTVPQVEAAPLVLNSTTTVEAFLSAQATTTAYWIASCESGFDPLAKSPTSSATGVFQFLKGTWKYYGQKYWGDEWANKDRLNALDNIRLGLWIIDTYGTHDWDASKECWKNKIVTNEK